MAWKATRPNAGFRKIRHGARRRMPRDTGGRVGRQSPDARLPDIHGGMHQHGSRDTRDRRTRGATTRRHRQPGPRQSAQSCTHRPSFRIITCFASHTPHSVTIRVQRWASPADAKPLTGARPGWASRKVQLQPAQPARRDCERCRRLARTREGPWADTGPTDLHFYRSPPTAVVRNVALIAPQEDPEVAVGTPLDMRTLMPVLEPQ